MSDLRVPRGDDGVFDVFVYQSNRVTPQNLTGYAFTATVKERLDDADPGMWQGTIGNGGVTVTNAASGSLRLTIPRATTAAWTPGVYLWDIQAVAVDGTKRTIDSGKLTVTADVTRA